MFLDKIDVSSIVTEHAATFRDYGTGKRSISDVCLFVGLPFVVAAVAVWTGIRIRVSAVTAILTASAIFVGLLPNLLILVLTFLMNAKGEPSDFQIRKRFMREITAHVSFSFVLSLALASVAIGALMLLQKDENPVGVTATFLLVLGSVALLLTMLMLIRRMHALVVSEFDRHKLKAA
jgi:hypothetical protein